MNYTFLFQETTLTSAQQDVVAEALRRYRNYLRRCKKQQKLYLRILRDIDDPRDGVCRAAHNHLDELREELRMVKDVRRLLIREGD